MSSIKDAEYAMKGETTPALALQEDYVPAPVLKKDESPNVNQEFVVFKMANPNKDGGMYIPGKDFVIDPRTITKENPDGNGPEMIRLLNGVTTIWAKEQKDLDADYIKKNIRTIEFPRGTRFITVPTWDKSMLEFMRMCRHNIRNPHRKGGSKMEFFEYDPNEIAKALLDKELLEVEMVGKAKEQSEGKMKRHAFYLGINLIDEIGRVKPIDRLRVDYMLAAKRDPKRFKDSFDSKEVDIQFLIREAIIDNKIDITKGDGKAYWGNNGGVICIIPKTEKPLQYLTQLALTNSKEGKEFLEQLQSRST